MLNLLVPDFEAPATGGTTFRLSSRHGKPLVIYFYPKDNTPGCTSEELQFRELYPRFSRPGSEIYGVARDSTFVINAAGVLRREWRGIKVPRHAGQVLDYSNTLISSMRYLH